MARPDQNKPVKPYFSRRGESIEEFAQNLFEGKITLLIQNYVDSDTVLNIGMHIARSLAQETDNFPQVSHQDFGYMPSEINIDNMLLISDAIQDAFRGTPSNQAALRVPIFRLEAIDGKLTQLQETFLILVRHQTKDFANVRRAQDADGQLVIAPVIQITSDMSRDLFKEISRVFSREGEGKYPDVVEFDTRSFDREHLLALLQPEFPDEDLEANPHFVELLNDHGGNSRLTFFIRSYARKDTVALINGDFELVPTEGKLGYVAKGPKASFSSIYQALGGHEMRSVHGTQSPAEARGLN